jgi:hypothetical protein
VLARRRVVALVVVLAVAVPLVAAAQRGGRFGRSRFVQYENAAYDGRFTFARIQYARYGGWAADYPTMERNLTTILQEITALRPNVTASNVHTFDDPELLKYPIAYLSEPGYWFPDDAEVHSLRRYLQKGGFLIVDDFHFPNEWNVFEAAMRRVVPDARIERLDLKHPVFNSSFRSTRSMCHTPAGSGSRG